MTEERAVRPERQLRRLVADLARVHVDDLEAVLGELDATERGTVETLLREYAGLVEPANDGNETPGCDRVAVSAWLVERFEERADIAMTAAGRSALQQTAVRLYPATASTTVGPSGGPGGRFLRLFHRGRATK